MKKHFVLIIFILFIASCAPQKVDSETGALPKSDIKPNDSASSTTDNKNNVTPVSSSEDTFDTDIYYNEIAKKFPFLYEDLIPKIRSLGYSHILMKKQPFFGFKVETAGMEWIIKSFMKRRLYLIDTVSLMVSVGFTKVFNNEGVKFTFTDVKNQKTDKPVSADGILVVEGYLHVKPLSPLSVTGMEYLLRLDYEVEAYIIDVKTSSKVWMGSTSWRRNFLATSMD